MNLLLSMNNWPTKKLGEVAKFQKGKLMPNSAVKREGVTPYILIDDLRSNSYSHFTPSNQGTACIPSDTLLVWDGANAGTVSGGLTGFVGSTIAKVSPAEEVDPEFLKIFLSSKFSEFNKQVHGAAIPHLNKDFVYNLPVSVPPIEIQKQIVERLDKIAEAQRLNGDLIQKSNELFQSLLHKELRPVGKNWDIKKLADIAGLQNGYAFKSNDYIEKSSVINFRMSNIRPDGTLDIFYSAKFLPENYATKYKEFLLRDGDIVIAMTDMANDPKILCVPTVIETRGMRLLLNQRVGKFIIDVSKLLPMYLRYSLSRKVTRNYLMSRGTQGLQINISKRDILSVNIPLPPLETQEQIVAKLSAAQEYKKLLLEQKAKLKELFDSVLHKSMKGEMTY